MKIKILVLLPSIGKHEILCEFDTDAFKGVGHPHRITDKGRNNIVVHGGVLEIDWEPHG